MDKEQKRKKIIEWNNLVNIGLVNGLTHTIQDGRNDDVKWIRGRLKLFESFSRCIMNLETNQSYEYSEKDLKEISQKGYNREEKQN